MELQGKVSTGRQQGGMHAIIEDSVVHGMHRRVAAWNVIKRDGRNVLIDIGKVRRNIERHSSDLGEGISVDLVLNEFLRNMFDGVTTQDIEKALVLAAAAFIEHDPAYNWLSARLYLQRAYKEVLGESTTEQVRKKKYREMFIANVRRGVQEQLLNEQLLEFDLEVMAAHLSPERDLMLGYMGVQTLFSRYFLKLNGQVIEAPQSFWMRVAMGLALGEKDREHWALKFYDIISSLRYIPSTPTLFHAGLVRAQLSSCYLSTIEDDLAHIFKVMGDNAQLSKWAGGIGNDWTNVRAVGSLIKGIKATSQGTVPFLKIANDVVAGITKSGIRRGGTCAYLETWHLDIEDFLDLRRNTGDERRRTHDMNTANWIPDLFMKRVEADAEWTLFSPDETPDLHGLYGRAFQARYEHYEVQARAGKIQNFQVILARRLWRKMLTRLFETGHPWITFKDPCNVRSPQDHAGIINSSNLCTEITLNTSAEETAVCNLGSVNLSQHVHDGAVDEALLADTIKSAMRMLDNVIGLNFYPTKEAETSNRRHRPVGLGMMGFQDALYKLGYAFESQEALEFADTIAEMISYYAILGSSELAKEYGAYLSYRGSKWDRGLFPIDTIDLLEQERGAPIDVPRTARMDWTPVRNHVKQWGMRNSNTMAIAPTATISNIAGCFPCIEPTYKHLYVKANVSGEFTIVNQYLVKDLKQEGLWGPDTRERLKFHDGSVQNIEQVPAALRYKHKTAFEIDQKHLVHMTARRAKWIDQSQSHNVFMQGVSGKALSDVYFEGWRCGLKTFYYLRSMGASQVEKSTLDAKKFGFTQLRKEVSSDTSVEAANDANGKASDVVEVGADVMVTPTIRACRLDNEECESCQ